MELKISSNFSITKLFYSKDITVMGESEGKSFSFIVSLKTIGDMVNDMDWNGAYHLFTMDVDKWFELFKVKLENSFDYIRQIVLELGKYKQYSEVANRMQKYLFEILPELKLDYKNSQLIVNDLIITPEIWNYIVYLLKLSNGEKVSKPRTFSSPEEKAFFLKQQEFERKINKIKQDANGGKGDEDSIIKAFLTITYAFPSLDFNYLFNQTLAQIRWLQKYAAESVSYSVNAQAFAAGNMKKGKKLDFFIK